MFRRGAIALTVGFALLAVTPALAQLQTSASNAIIYDYDTGDVLYCKNCQEPMPPSSMSKLMTVELVFQRLKDGRLKLTDTFHVSEAAWRQGQNDNESKMWVALGSDVSIDDLLKGIIVVSGGDACVVVAEGLGGSESAFAQMENKRAQELGLAKSHFVNSSGLPDPGQYMSAFDLVKLSAYLIREYPKYYPYFAMKEFPWDAVRSGNRIVKMRQGNRNELLYENIGVDGLKTGHTEAGGYGMVTSALRNGRRIITVVNGLSSMKERAAESRRLLDSGYRDFRHYDLVAANATVGMAEVFGGSQPTVPVRVKAALGVTINPDLRGEMKVALRYQGPLRAPIAEGAQVGSLVISVPTKPDTIVPVYAAQAVSRSGIFGKILIGIRALLGKA